MENATVVIWDGAIILVFAIGMVARMWLQSKQSKDEFFKKVMENFAQWARIMTAILPLYLALRILPEDPKIMAAFDKLVEALDDKIDRITDYGLPREPITVILWFT